MRKLIGILVAGLISTAAFAADTSVPNMTAGGAMSDTDLIYCAQSGGTTDRKCTGAQVKTYTNTSCVVAKITTTESIANSNQNCLVTFSNASPVAVSIAQAGSGGNFAAGWVTSPKNLGAGTVTITPTTSTIDGAATLVLTTGQGVDLYSDGTNYFTQGGKAGGGAGTVTTTGSPANGNLTQFSGASSITNGNLSGDVTTSGTLAVTAKGIGPINYTASNWHIAPPGGIGATGATFTASQIYCRLHQFPTTVTIGTVGVNVTTGGGGNIQIAYYSNNASNLPGTLLSNTGSISTTTTGNKSGALGANIQVGPGGSSTGRDVWICVNSDNTTHVMAAFTTQDFTPGVRMGAPTQAGISVASNSIGLDNISCSGANCNGGVSTFGTWPTLTGSTWTYNAQVSRFPIQQFQVVSSP